MPHVLSPQFTSLDDNLDDGNQDVEIRFSMLSEDTLYKGLIGSVIVTNKDNDGSELLVFNNSEVVEEGGMILVNVKLSSSPANAVTVTCYPETVIGQV